MAAVGCVVLVLLVCAIVAENSSGPSATLGCGQTSKFGPVPAWAGEGTLAASATVIASRNKSLVRQYNASQQCLDFVLYGDSIVADLGAGRAYADVFRKHFGDVNAAALGVGGTNVEQLTWRIAGGTERFARPPKCIALLIGTNNAGGDPSFERTGARADELLRWLQAAYPSTRLVLMALLPNVYNDVRRANAVYKAVAAQRGVKYVECGLSLNPRDKAAFRDGIHLAAQGHDTVLRCLRNAVNPHIT